MGRVWGGVLVATGFIACPCHLVVTLPLILGVLGGTGLGAYLTDNQGLVYGVATAYFIFGLAGGLYLWNRKGLNRAPARRGPTQRKTIQNRKLTIQSKGGRR